MAKIDTFKLLISILVSIVVMLPFAIILCWQYMYMSVLLFIVMYFDIPESKDYIVFIILLGVLTILLLGKTYMYLSIVLALIIYILLNFYVHVF